MLGSRPSEPRRRADLTRERPQSPRPLICVVGVDPSFAYLEFGIELVRAIAGAGGVPAALLASSAGDWPTGTPDRLRAVGARDVRVLHEPNIDAATMTALADQTSGTICVGIGWPIAACVQGLLLICVGGRAGGTDLRQAEGVDLYATSEGANLAQTLGTWLAQRLDAAAPNGYPREVAQQTKTRAF